MNNPLPYSQMPLHGVVVSPLRSMMPFAAGCTTALVFPTGPFGYPGVPHGTYLLGVIEPSMLPNPQLAFRAPALLNCSKPVNAQPPGEL
jgi:hypothetical protein